MKDAKITYMTPSESVLGFPGGSVVKNPPANAGDTGLIPGSGRSTCISQCAATIIKPALESMGSATTEPVRGNYLNSHVREPVPRHKESHCNEKPVLTGSYLNGSTLKPRHINTST